MNFECLYCQSISTAVRTRGGGAVAVFRCSVSGETRVYLLAGEPLACRMLREIISADTPIESETPDESSEGQHGSR
jgi:hypothetical protein